jgi:hypothetical protein
VLEADEAAMLTGERSPLPCFRRRHGVGDGCGGGGAGEFDWVTQQIQDDVDRLTPGIFGSA